MLGLVLTIDQRDSRHADIDGVPGLIAKILDRRSGRAPLLEEPPAPLLDFARTVGDEIQGVLSLDEGSVFLTLPAVLEAVARSGSWWIGAAVGPVTLGRTPAESRGPGFVAARDAVELAKKPSQSESGSALDWGVTNLFVNQSFHQRFAALPAAAPTTVLRALADSPPHMIDVWKRWRVADATMAGYVGHLRSQSAAGQQAIDAVRVARSQTAAAQTLDISQQALSLRLAAARWRTESQLAAAFGLAVLDLAGAIRRCEDDDDA